MSQVLKNDKFARSSIRETVALGRKSQGRQKKKTPQGHRSVSMRSHPAKGKWHGHLAITGPLGARDWNAYLDRKLGLIPERVLDFKPGR